MTDRIGRYDYQKRRAVEDGEAWLEWVKEIPAFAVPQGCRVRLCPPFAGALARICLEDTQGNQITSIYFDVFENLGIMNGPYFEIYPGTDPDETERFYLDEISELEAALEAVLAATQEAQSS